MYAVMYYVTSYTALLGDVSIGVICWCRQKVCERLIRSKVVELQSRLKQSAITMIKQMDVSFTERIDEIQAARHSMMSDVSAVRRLIDGLRTNTDLDGLNSDALLESVSSSLASIPLIQESRAPSCPDVPEI